MQQSLSAKTALLVTCLIGPGLAATPDLFQAQLLDEYVESLGARCLDGTPGRYWIQLGSGANRSSISWHNQGGGWCLSEEECASRAFGERCYLGSSRPECFLQQKGDIMPGNLSAYNETMNWQDIPSCLGARWCGGLLNNDPETNPLTHDWTKIFVEYCDGGSTTGNNDTEIKVQYEGHNRTMYYRGFRILQAILEDLETKFGLLRTAERVLVSGGSAGGLATYYHADYMKSQIPQAVVRAVPDSGWFLSTPFKPSWPAALTWMTRAMNSTAALNQNCVRAAQAAGRDPTEACVMPEDTAPHIDVPLFVMNSRFDPTMDKISGDVGSANISAVQEVGALLLASVKERALGLGQSSAEGATSGKVLQTAEAPQAPRGSENVAFITACHEHCGQWTQGQVLGPDGKFDDFNVTIGGITAAEAADRWWRWVDEGARPDGGGLVPQSRLWLQGADYPCKNCCAGGDGL